MRSENAFVTLTYSNDTLPKTSNNLPTLIPKHLQDWLKRLRKEIEPLRVRYYLVGEYGDETQRPHYHVALFGFPTCRLGNSDLALPRACTCNSCEIIRKTWSYGKVHLGQLVPESAQYIAGYVTKKMTSKDDVRLSGRHPEFARMSLRPGIGADALHEVADVLLTLNLVDPEGDVPSALRHGSRLLPLGRYLRRKLRLLVGLEANAPEKTLAEIAEQLRPMFDAAFNASRSKKSVLIEEGNQKVLNMEARQKIFKQRKSI